MWRGLREVQRPSMKLSRLMGVSPALRRSRRMEASLKCEF